MIVGMPESYELVPRGAFSLRAAAELSFGPSEGRAPTFDGHMRLAFPLDGGAGYAGATLTQARDDAPVAVALELRHGLDVDGAEAASTALSQVSRVLSLDHDGTGFDRVGERDPVIGDLQREHPGQRPVLFHSPYEAAAWAIMSTRRPAARAAAVRRELSAALGETFELAGEEVPCFPLPEHLRQIGEEFPGLTLEQIGRLLDVAEAASIGVLDAEALRALGPQPAYERVQQLKGIGPFYAGLIVLRAVGFADAPLLMAEPRLLSAAARLYGLSGTPSLEWLNQRAEQWRPYRIWTMVLIRLASGRGPPVEDQIRR
jgi:DNA-3-methyladenine glycosylase II